MEVATANAEDNGADVEEFKDSPEGVPEGAGLPGAPDGISEDRKQRSSVAGATYLRPENDEFSEARQALRSKSRSRSVASGLGVDLPPRRMESNRLKHRASLPAIQPLEQFEIADDGSPERKVSLQSSGLSAGQIFPGFEIFNTGVLNSSNDRSSSLSLEDIKQGRRAEYRCKGLYVRTCILAFLAQLFSIIEVEVLFDNNEPPIVRSDLTSYKAVKDTLDPMKQTTATNALKFIALFFTLGTLYSLIRFHQTNHQARLQKNQEVELSFLKGSDGRYFWLELFALAITPIPFVNVDCYVDSYYTPIEVYNLDCMACALMTARMYLVPRLIYYFTDYSDPANNYISMISRIPMDTKFAFKAVIESRTVEFLVCSFTFCVFWGSYLVRIAEWPLATEKVDRPIMNYLWLTLVTITSVGYGDETPQSQFGRVVMSVVMIIGLIIAGFLFATFSMYLQLSNHEQKMVAYIRRKNFIVQRKDLAARSIQKVWRLYSQQRQDPSSRLSATGAKAQTHTRVALKRMANKMHRMRVNEYHLITPGDVANQMDRMQAFFDTEFRKFQTDLTEMEEDFQEKLLQMKNQQAAILTLLQRRQPAGASGAGAEAPAGLSSIRTKANVTGEAQADDSSLARQLAWTPKKVAGEREQANAIQQIKGQGSSADGPESSIRQQLRDRSAALQEAGIGTGSQSVAQRPPSA